MTLYARELLAADGGARAAGSGFPGVTLARNVRFSTMPVASAECHGSASRLSPRSSALSRYSFTRFIVARWALASTSFARCSIVASKTLALEIFQENEKNS
jgi:hypothetical protein